MQMRCKRVTWMTLNKTSRLKWKLRLKLYTSNRI